MRPSPLFVAVALACVSPALAQQASPGVLGLKQGDIETAFTFEWYKVKEVSGSTLLVTASGGYLITDQLEGGVALTYSKIPGSSGGSVGVFGQWNFTPQQPFTPFVGVRLVPFYFSDEGDLYKNSWEVVAGAKYYPYEHAGVIAAAYYGRSNLENALPGFGDTSSRYGLRAGFLVKF